MHLQGDRADHRTRPAPLGVQAGEEDLVVGLDLQCTPVDDPTYRSRLRLRQAQGVPLLVLGGFEQPPVRPLDHRPGRAHNLNRGGECQDLVVGTGWKIVQRC